MAYFSALDDLYRLGSGPYRATDHRALCKEEKHYRLVHALIHRLKVGLSLGNDQVGRGKRLAKCFATGRIHDTGDPIVVRDDDARGKSIGVARLREFRPREVVERRPPRDEGTIYGRFAFDETPFVICNL